MKVALNTAIAGGTVNEVRLFREMANLFNTSISKCTYVEEVHGRKGFIDYYSTFKCASKKVEIADLLIFTYDKFTKQTRICFLQAKYKNDIYNDNLKFDANIFQWELLRDKPVVTSTKFPTNILNFRNDYASITAYGIFYYDNTGNIDFLYTLPRHINPLRDVVPPENKAIRKYKFIHNCCKPNILCNMGFDINETISTCSINIFANQILNCRIGAPINSTIRPNIIRMLKSMRLTPNNALVINELLNYLDDNSTIDDNRLNNADYNPAAIIVVTDSSKAENIFIND